MSPRSKQTHAGAWGVAVASTILALSCSTQNTQSSNDAGPSGDATVDATQSEADGASSTSEAGDSGDDGGNACAEAGVCEEGCHVGAVACDGTCGALSNVPDGTPCGASGACESGQCVACSPGNPCSPAAAPCHNGALTCSISGSSCVDQGTEAAPGTACGAAIAKTYCDASGGCTCKGGVVCHLTANPCHIGITSCVAVASPGVAICIDSGSSLLNGSSCGVGMACSFGTCFPITCAPTTADGGVATCTPANACDQGTIACPAGEFSPPSCTDTGTPLAAGASCEGGTCNGDGGCAP